MNGNNLSTIQQDSKQILAKSKSLLDITHKILAKKGNGYNVSNNFTHNFFYLQGHISAVRSLAITSDDKKVISGGDDHTIKLWDISSGMCIKTLEGHTRSVTSVAITPDGKHIVSGSDDLTIKLWDIQSGKELQSFEGHTDSVNCIAITPNGKIIVSSDGSFLRKSVGVIKLWDIQSGKELQSFEGHTAYVNCIAITPDGKNIVSGSKDKTIKIWDISNGVCINTLEGHDKAVRRVQIIDNGKKILSGGDDHTIKLWDIQSGICTKTINNIANYGRFNITPDEKKIVSSENSYITIWDIEIDKCIGRFIGHENNITSIAISSNGKKIISGSFDKTIKIWDIQNATLPKIYKIQEGQRWINDANSCNFMTYKDETYSISDIESGEIIYTTNEQTLRIEITPDGKNIVDISDNNTFKILDIQSGKEIQSFEGHTAYVYCIAITPDGKNIVSGSDDHTIKLWDISSGMCIKTLEGHTRSITFLAITPDGKNIVSGSDDLTIKLWDIQSGICTKTLEEKKNKKLKYFYNTPDGTKVVSANYDNIIIWDIESGEIIHTIRKEIERDNIIVTNSTIIFGDYSEIKIIDIYNGLKNQDNFSA